MKLNDFVTRFCVVPVLFLVASLLGAITSSWWAAPLIGFAFALAFTAISEHVLRQKLMGVIGKSALAWYSVHLIAETITIVALAWFSSVLFGMHTVPGWTFTVMAFLTWGYLCKEMIFNLPSMFAIWLATRR
jgi:hypothetical protein